MNEMVVRCHLSDCATHPRAGVLGACAEVTCFEIGGTSVACKNFNPIEGITPFGDDLGENAGKGSVGEYPIKSGDLWALKDVDLPGERRLFIVISYDQENAKVVAKNLAYGECGTPFSEGQFREDFEKVRCNSFEEEYGDAEAGG